MWRSWVPRAPAGTCGSATVTCRGPANWDLDVLFVVLTLKGKAQYRAQVEVGRDGDVDSTGHVADRIFSTKEALDLQGFFREAATDHFPVKLIRAPEVDHRYIVVRDGDAEDVGEIGVFSRYFKDDLRELARRFSGASGLYPPKEVWFLQFVDARTVAVECGRADRLLTPFNASGVFLAPIIVGFPPVAFFGGGRQ